METEKCTEGQIDLLQDVSLPSLCGIRIAKPDAVTSKWRFFCKSSGKVSCSLGSDMCTTAEVCAVYQ